MHAGFTRKANATKHPFKNINLPEYPFLKAAKTI